MTSRQKVNVKQLLVSRAWPLSELAKIDYCRKQTVLVITWVSSCVKDNIVHTANWIITKGRRSTKL